MKASSTALLGAVALVGLLVPTNTAPALEPGIRFGLSSATQRADDATHGFPYDAGRVKNPTLGLQLHVPFRGWGVSSVLNYIQKGRQEPVAFADTSAGRYRTAYVWDDPSYASLQIDLRIEVPVGSASFYVLAGPTVNYLLDNDRVIASLNWDDQYWFPVDVPVKEFYRWVGGVAIGLGQDIVVGRHTMFLEVRYDRDVTSAWDVSQEQSFRSYGGGPVDGSIYNETFYFVMGFRFWTSKAKPKSEVLPAGQWLPVNAPPPR